MKLYAYINCGRWMITCPKCGAHSELKKWQDTIICGACYPRIRAMAYDPYTTKSGRVILRPIADVDMRAETRALAEKAGELYEVIYPEDRKEIEKIMSARPAINRYWGPTETVEDLKAENLAHGLEVKDGMERN